MTPIITKVIVDKSIEYNIFDKKRYQVQLKCEPIGKEFVGSIIQIDNFEYRVLNETTLISNAYIKNYRDFLLFLTGRGLTQIENNYNSPYPVITDTTYCCVNQYIDDGKIPQKMTYVPASTNSVNLKAYNIRIGQQVVFQDKHQNMFIGTIVNDFGAIEVSFAEDIGIAFTNGYADAMNYIAKVKPLFSMSAKSLNLSDNPIPDIKHDKFDIFSNTQRNFIYLHNGIIQSTDKNSNDAFLHLVYNSSTPLHSALIGSVITIEHKNYEAGDVYVEPKKYLVLSPVRLMSLNPSHKVQNLIGTTYAGSKLQDEFGTPQYSLNLHQTVIANIYNGPFNAFDEQNRWVVTFPKNKIYNLTQALLEQNTLKRKYYIPCIGDIVKIVIGNKEVKFLIADSDTLISILPSHALNLTLEDFNKRYDVEYTHKTIVATVSNTEVSNNSIAMDYLHKSLETTNSKISIALVKKLTNTQYTNSLSGINVSMQIQSEEVEVTIRFELYAKATSYSLVTERDRKTTHKAELLIVENEEYLSYKSLVDACLTTNTTSTIPGAPTIRWIIEKDNVNFILDNNNIKPHLYSIAYAKREFLSKLGDIILYDETLNKEHSKPIRTLNKNMLEPIGQFHLSFSITSNILPQTLDGRNITINGLRGKLIYQPQLSLTTNNNASYEFLVNIDTMVKLPEKDNVTLEEAAIVLKNAFKTIEKHLKTPIVVTQFSIRELFRKDRFDCYEWRIEKPQPETKTIVKKSETTRDIGVITNITVSRKKEIAYNQLKNCEITLLTESEAAYIAPQYLDRNIDYWINSETIMETNITGTSFAMGKIINEDGCVTSRDVIMEAEVLPVIRVKDIASLGLAVGDEITILVENQMKDYYTAISPYLLLRKTSLGKAQMSNSFIMPDIAVGSTIPTYSKHSPIAKLIDDYIAKLENTENYSIPQIPGLDMTPVVKTVHEDRLKEIESILLQEANKIKAAQKAIEDSAKLIEKLQAEITSIKQKE